MNLGGTVGALALFAAPGRVCILIVGALILRTADDACLAPGVQAAAP